MAKYSGGRWPIVWDQLDPECVPLVRALNALPGLRTQECCCGHRDRPFWVILSTETKDRLLPLLRLIERPRYYQKWALGVETGPEGAGVVFRLKGGQGSAAYQLALELARDIEEGL